MNDEELLLITLRDFHEIPGSSEVDFDTPPDEGGHYVLCVTDQIGHKTLVQGRMQARQDAVIIVGSPVRELTLTEARAYDEIKRLIEPAVKKAQAGEWDQERTSLPWVYAFDPREHPDLFECSRIEVGNIYLLCLDDTLKAVHQIDDDLSEHGLALTLGQEDDLPIRIYITGARSSLFT